jgi:hypothetical protein
MRRTLARYEDSRISKRFVRWEDHWDDEKTTFEDFASKFWQQNAQRYKETWKNNEMFSIQFG